MSDIPSTEFVHDYRILIAIAEECHRAENPSYSWHIFDWMAWRLRNKYLRVQNHYGIVQTGTVT